MFDLDVAVNAVISDIVEMRHRLHRIPELAGEEQETSALIRRELAAIDGIEVLNPLCGTDVVALLHGAHPGRTVGLRADIDALSVEEKSGVAYASCHAGRMHACGHDGHTAMLLGAAKVLAAHRDQLHGTVKFIFQPGEEVKALGRKLVEAGVLEHPRVDIITAMHNWPGMPAGMFATRPGAIMGAAAHFYITLRGRGGHGSTPEVTADPIIAGAMLVQALQTIVSRNVDPQQAAVVSVCRFNSSSKSSNVIPETVRLDGTTRALSQATAELVEKRLREIVSGICAATGTSAEIVYNSDYPVTENDPDAVHFAESLIGKYFGEKNFTMLEKSAMTAEDFAYFLQQTPGVFMRLGAGEDHLPLHHEQFDFNDAALFNGIKYFAAFALEGGKA